MNFLKSNAIALVALVIAIYAVMAPGSGPTFGQITDTSNFDYFQATTNGGFKVGTNTIINGSGNISQPTSNTATSTFSGGCIQTTATSTATPVRIVIGNTQSASTTFQGGTSNFTVLAQYGSCPA